MFEGNSWGRAWKFRYRVDFEKRGGEGYRPGQRMERFQRVRYRRYRITSFNAGRNIVIGVI